MYQTHLAAWVWALMQQALDCKENIYNLAKNNILHSSYTTIKNVFH